MSPFRWRKPGFPAILVASIVAGSLIPAVVRARVLDDCSEDAAVRASADCQAANGPSWSTTHFAIESTLHEFRWGGPSYVVAQWKCSVAQPNVNVSVYACGEAGRVAERMFESYSSTEPSWPDLQCGEFEGSLARRGGFVDGVARLNLSASWGEYHLLGIDPRSGRIRDLLPEGVKCSEHREADLDGDGSEEFVCRGHDIPGVSTLPQVFRFEGTRYVERTERYTALLWIVAQEYRCVLNSGAGDYAFSWLVELADRFDVESAREMLSESQEWQGLDVSGHVACILAACADPLTLWAAARTSNPGDRRDWVLRTGAASECLVRESVAHLVHTIVPDLVDGAVDLLDVLRATASPGVPPRRNRLPAGEDS